MRQASGSAHSSPRGSPEASLSSQRLRYFSVSTPSSRARPSSLPSRGSSGLHPVHRRNWSTASSSSPGPTSSSTLATPRGDSPSAATTHSITSDLTVDQSRRTRATTSKTS